MKDNLIKAIEAIEGILSVAIVAAPVDLISGETLLQINVYYPTPAPDLNIHVGDNIDLKAEVK
jgi:hypothetical protein